MNTLTAMNRHRGSRAPVSRLAKLAAVSAVGMLVSSGLLLVMVAR